MVLLGAESHVDKAGLRDGGTPPEDPWPEPRGDGILEAPNMDLESLNALAADYGSARMLWAAADLRRRRKYLR